MIILVWASAEPCGWHDFIDGATTFNRRSSAYCFVFLRSIPEISLSCKWDFWLRKYFMFKRKAYSVTHTLRCRTCSVSLLLIIRESVSTSVMQSRVFRVDRASWHWIHLQAWSAWRSFSPRRRPRSPVSVQVCMIFGTRFLQSTAIEIIDICS